jgi:predicted Zn-dependent protease
LILQVANELEAYSQEEILFRQNNRSVVIKYGPLDGSLLGLTECTFYSDNIRTNCVITIKQEINPDLATSNAERLTKERLFYGVLRHEIGHAFGMGHNLVDTNNLMYPIFNFSHVEDQNVLLKFISDLTNFRYNGAASGIRTIFDDRNSSN